MDARDITDGRTRRWHTRRPAMKNVSINIPRAYIDLIQQMKEVGLTPSCSEYIRMAVWEKFSRDISLMRSLMGVEVAVPPKKEIYEYPYRFEIAGKVWQKQ